MITRFATLTTRLSVAFAVLFTIAACGGGNGGSGFFPDGGGGAGNPVTITTTALANAIDGIVYTELVVADGGEEPYSWTVVDDGGTGFSINNEGILSGIAPQSGDYGLTLQVADSASSTDKASFILTVTGETPQPLAIATATDGLPPTEEGKEYLALLEAVGGAGDYQWAMVSDGNSGLQLSYDGVLNGTAPAEGQYPIKVSVMDETGTATSILILIVTGPSSPLAITTTSLPGGTVDERYAAVVAASGGDKPYTWTLVSTGGQSGLSLSKAGVLSGSPALAGTFGIIVKVSDGTYTDELALPLTIVSQGGEVEVLTIATTSLPVADRVLYSAALEASGGEKPYSWSGGDTSVPGTGFTVINSGSITGNTNDVPPGLYSYTVTVADSAGDSDTRSFVIDVAGGDSPPVAILTGNPLPDATATLTYAQVMRAVGGAQDLDWSVLETTNSAGEVVTNGPNFDPPGGSTELGVLYWSAADIVEGNYSVVIQVQDATISADVVTFSLRALGAPVR